MGVAAIFQLFGSIIDNSCEIMVSGVAPLLSRHW